MNNKGMILDKEMLLVRDKKLIEHICTNDDFAYFFFHEKCKPLFSNILWKIYGNNADYDELVNELYYQLKRPNKEGEYWHSLRTFDYRTSLFDWIKVVAVRFFYTPSDELISLPDSIIDSGLFDEIISKLSKSEYRKFLYFKYVKKNDTTIIAEKLNIESDKISQLSRRTIKALKSVIKNDYPEYYDCIFKKNEIITTDIDTISVANINDSVKAQDSQMDITKYLNAMPNERYKYVLKSLYINDISPENLALEMDVEVSNIYNIKKRALDQIRDVVLCFNDIHNISKYINLIVDDRKQLILISLFKNKEDYETICSKLNISEKCFNKLKKEAIKELKSLIFK